LSANLTSNSSGLGGGGLSSAGFFCLTSFCSVGSASLGSLGLRLRCCSSLPRLLLGSSAATAVSSCSLLLGCLRRRSSPRLEADGAGSAVRGAAGATLLYSVVLVAAVTGRLERVLDSVVVDADTRCPEVGRRLCWRVLLT